MEKWQRKTTLKEYGSMLHEGAIKLNCGRSALAYLIEGRKIKKIAMPKFMCDSCDEILKRYGVRKREYHVDFRFNVPEIELEESEWIYVVNYYGQLSNEDIYRIKAKYERVILDSSQSYFQEPVTGVDTLYTCRKYFGVPDGAILYTNAKIERELERDVSYRRMNHLLGRYEKTASEFYKEYIKTEAEFKEMPLMKMSKLTENLLHGIDYRRVKYARTTNFAFLAEKFRNINQLYLTIPEGAFMYPLLIQKGAEIRKKLQEIKIYVPCLWPNIMRTCEAQDVEYKFAENILPLPVDQRYTTEDMEYIVERVMQMIKKKRCLE